MEAWYFLLNAAFFCRQSVTLLLSHCCLIYPFKKTSELCFFRIFARASLHCWHRIRAKESSMEVKRGRKCLTFKISQPEAELYFISSFYNDCSFNPDPCSPAFGFVLCGCAFCVELWETPIVFATNSSIHFPLCLPASGSCHAPLAPPPCFLRAPTIRKPALLLLQLIHLTVILKRINITQLKNKTISEEINYLTRTTKHFVTGILCMTFWIELLFIKSSGITVCTLWVNV